MLVPIVLIIPALIAGLSLWYNWGPLWPALAIVLAGAMLALVLDYRRALRFGLLGAVVGLITCPALLLLNRSDWYLFITWITSVMVLAALLVPLVLLPDEKPEQRAQVQPAEVEAVERLGAAGPMSSD